MSQSPNRLVATILGAVYVALGLIGFTVALEGGAFSTTGGYLFGVLGVNVLQNVMHVVIGAALLACGLVSVRAAKSANSVIGTVFLLLGLVGLFIIGTDTNILALNGAGNVLHFGSSIVLLAVGLGAEKVRAAESSGTR